MSSCRCLKIGLGSCCSYWHNPKGTIALGDSCSKETITCVKYACWVLRACLNILQWISVRCLSKDYILYCQIKVRYWEMNFQRETLLYSTTAARWKSTQRHRAKDFISTSNTERSLSFSYCIEKKNYSSDLLSLIFHTFASSMDKKGLQWKGQIALCCLKTQY